MAVDPAHRIGKDSIDFSDIHLLFKFAAFHFSYNLCSRIRVKLHRFIRHPAYCVRYSVVPTNTSPTSKALCSSVITTLVYNDTRL